MQLTRADTNRVAATPTAMAKHPGAPMSKALLDAMSAHIAVLDEAGDIVLVNAAWCDFARRNGLNHENSGAGLNYVGICESVSGDDAYYAEAAARGIRDLLGGRQQAFNLEYPCFGPEGDLWFEMRAVRCANGYDGVLVAHEHTTRSKRAEDAALCYQAELAQMIRADVLGGMAAALAHEINQPLSACSDYCHAAVSRAQSRAVRDDALTALLQDVSRQIHRAGDITRQFKSFLKRGTPTRESATLNLVVREAVKLGDPMRRRHKATLRLCLTDGLPRVDIDPVQIQQVLLNLELNALEAMNQADSHPRVVTIASNHHDDGQVELSVSDTGPGVDSTIREALYQPFRTTKADGLGMGLWLSRSIVESHRGTLACTSSSLIGSTFRVTLPAKKGVEP